MTTHAALGAPARGRRKRLTALCGAIAVLASVMFPAHSASAVDATPTPGVTEAAGKLDVYAIAGTAGSTRVGSGVKLTATVTNTTSEEAPVGSVSFAVSTSMLDNSEAIDSFLNGATLLSFRSLGSVATPIVAATSTAEVSHSVSGSTAALASLTPGTYGMQVTYTAGNLTSVFLTVLTVMAQTTSDSLVTVIPLVAPAGDRGLLDGEALAGLTVPEGDLSRRLDAADVNTVLAIDPAIVASIRALGTAAPTSATEWLDRLMQLPNDRFALPFADADLAVQVAAGLTAPLEPTSLISELRAENFTKQSEEAPLETPTPTQTAPPQDITLPTLEQLTDIGEPLLDVAWPRTGSATTAVLDFTAAGFTLVSSSQLGGTNGLATAGSHQVIGYDESLSAAASALSGLTDDASIARTTATTTAHARFTLAGANGTPVVVILDRTESAAAPAMAAVSDALRAAGTSSLAFSSLTQRPAVTAALTDAEAPIEDGARLVTWLDAMPQISVLASMLTDPALLEGRERAHLLQLLAASGIDAPSWPARVAAYDARMATVLDAVGISPRKSLMIVSKGVNVPVWVRNDLPWPISVTLETTPTDVRLEVQRLTTVEAPAASTTRTFVPVTSGISNGAAALKMQLLTADGAKVGKQERTEVTVRADWETIGLLVIGGLVVLLLTWGTYRTIRRRKRVAAGLEAADPNRAEARETFRDAHEIDAEISEAEEPRG